MGFLSVIVAGVAAWLCCSADYSFWMWLSIIAAMLSFWSYGVMHNFAVDSAKRRADCQGGFGDFAEQDLDTVPGKITAVNMVTNLASAALLIGAVVVTWL